MDIGILYGYSMDIIIGYSGDINILDIY